MHVIARDGHAIYPQPEPLAQAPKLVFYHPRMGQESSPRFEHEMNGPQAGERPPIFPAVLVESSAVNSCCF
jgi:hypothetical protein